ncbi:hypothetical protein LshimejAT787_0805130 [Lyophyllum shimeji]|uniref:Uncharacterized protein n=1 Tax=Lyophyllum shimeji TaxID=47721 RepID=A0A9P3PQ85_LYOSH|nr:hypothetical protein LshimejAT787_0805130 [Lyophyllum shimeji]
MVEDSDEDQESDIEITHVRTRKTSSTVSAPSDNEDEEVLPSVPRRSASRSSMVDSSHARESDDEGSERAEEDRSDVDDEELINKLRLKWGAPVYAFFEPIPEVEWRTVQPRKGSKMFRRRYFKFKCIATHCTAKGKNGRYVVRAASGSDKSSTKNLRRHVEECWKARDILKGRDNRLRDGSILKAFEEKTVLAKPRYSGNPPTKAEIKADHVRWVCESKRPFEIVNDEGYHRLMKTGRPHHYIPSVSTVRRDLRVAFAKCRHFVSRILQKHQGALHFGTDTWTSPNHRAFIALIVHLEVDGKAKSWCLDVVELPRSHTGLALAEAFTNVLKEYGIAEKKLACVCDNATPNDVMVDSFDQWIPNDPGQANRVRCFCHVINLVSKSILALFDSPKKNDEKKTTKGKGQKKRKGAQEVEEEGIEEDDIEMEDVEGLDVDGFDVDEAQLAELEAGIEVEEAVAQDEEAERGEEKDNVEGWVDERKAMSATEQAELRKDVLPTRRMLVKIRKIAYSVKNSSTILLPLWHRLCREHGVAFKMLPRDVKTRWNSTYDMLKVAYDYRKVVDALTDQRSANLRDYEVSEEEWKLARQLVEVLEVFKESTEFFSRKDEAYLSNVIPAMDIVDDALATAISEKTYNKSILAAIKIGKCTLNRYYSKTDMSELYRVAMVLDPRYKLEYFRNAG